MNRGTSSSNVASQGLSHPFLKTFVFVFRDPTDRPWVSEDVYSTENLENPRVLFRDSCQIRGLQCKTSAPQSLRDLRNRKASKTIRTWNRQTLRACLHVGGDPR